MKLILIIKTLLITNYSQINTLTTFFNLHKSNITSFFFNKFDNHRFGFQHYALQIKYIMLQKIIKLSIDNKLIILLITAAIFGFGLFSLTQIPIGAVPDITNNQVQVITTSRNLSTQDIEQFITYPVELEMANLPGVTEIRSISKFGLSVVTIVFNDEIGTYLPRQLIAEKIKSAAEKIPEGFGSPEI